MSRIDRTNPKGDRALQLIEQGIEPAAIAERLGVKHQSLSGLIHDARKRRERKKKLEAQE